MEADWCLCTAVTRTKQRHAAGIFKPLPAFAWCLWLAWCTWAGGRDSEPVWRLAPETHSKYFWTWHQERPQIIFTMCQRALRCDFCQLSLLWAAFFRFLTWRPQPCNSILLIPTQCKTSFHCPSTLCYRKLLTCESTQWFWDTGRAVMCLHTPRF